MQPPRRRARFLLSRSAIAGAVVLCLATGAVLELFTSVVVADDVQRNRVVFVGASSSHAQARVRPPSTHRLQQPAVVHTSLHRAETSSVHAVFTLVPPLRSRQRLVQLAILRI